ncbi:hypothetical protein Peur_018959 [Populus x canadensis]
MQLGFPKTGEVDCWTVCLLHWFSWDYLRLVTHHTSSPLQDATDVDYWGWFARVALHSGVHVISEWLMLLAVSAVCLLIKGSLRFAFGCCGLLKLASLSDLCVAAVCMLVYWS